MTAWRISLLAGACLAACAPAAAKTAGAAPMPAAPAPATPAGPAAMFGVRESIGSISLSPDGKHIAYVAPIAGQGSSLYTVDLATGQSTVALTARGDPERMAGCHWVSEQRLVCDVFSTIVPDRRPEPVSRIVALDADGGNFKMLSERENSNQRRWSLYGGSIIDWLPGTDGEVLMMRDYIPERQLKTRIGQTGDGLGVVRLNTKTLAAQHVESPHQGVDGYITDGHGNIRLLGSILIAGATQMMTDTISWSYRAKGSRDWKPFSKTNTVTHVGLDPFAIDPDGDVAYALDQLDGRRALYRVALDGSGRKELAYANPKYDVDDVVTLGRDRRVVGATFISDRRETVYFDPKLNALAKSLSKALPGLPLINFADESTDGSKLLIFAGSDTDPGRYYIFDRATHKLNELMLDRPQLENVTLAPQKPVTFPGSDGVSIPAYLTLPPGSNGRGLPALVMPHGGPESRDEWNFDWLVQYFAHQGYAVLQPVFRGSTGYGDAWFAKNGFLSWRIAIGDIVDAGKWLVSSGVTSPDKLAIFGWSYGGYAALQANVLAPNLFKAAVAVAPVTDLPMLVEESRGYTDFALMRRRVGEGAEAIAGSPAQNAARIKVPVMLFHGTLDRNVDYNQSRSMAAALDRAGVQNQLITYPKLDHQLDDSAARADMLEKSDTFLKKAMGIH